MNEVMIEYPNGVVYYEVSNRGKRHPPLTKISISAIMHIVMSEKQIPYNGPDKETHIKVERAERLAKIARRRGALAGFVVGATIATGAAIGVNVAGEHNDASADLHTDKPKATHSADVPQFEEITARKHDTEWDMAERINDNADPRETMVALEAANPSLKDHIVYSGETYSVPVKISDHDFKK